MITRLAICMSLAAPAIAGQVTYTAQLPYQTLLGTSGSLHTFTLSVPQFDPLLGRLNRVYVSAQLDVQGSVTVENTSSSAVPPPSFYVGATGDATLCGQTAFAFFDHPFSAAGLGPFDGTLDFSGPSSGVITFPTPTFPGPIAAGKWVNDLGSGIPGTPLGLTTPALLDLVTGTASLTIGINTFPNIQPLWNSSSLPWTFTMDASPRVDITYYFDSFPARFCTGEVAGGCPCANTAGPTGGCPNSIAVDGADLVPSGVSSASADSFVLAASSMPSTTFVLFFQGTNSPQAGTAFGDGKLCVGGLFTRLATKQAVNGSSSYPGAGEPSISAIGGPAIGALNSYQGWYRDADLSFCTASTFNLTSAVSTVWTP